VRRYDRDLRWWFTVANDRPEVLEQLLFHRHTLPGFNDGGAQADIVLIDPEALRAHDTDANRRMVYRDIFEHEQLVNRSDGVVTAVFIAGEPVWDGREFAPALGTRKLGRPLTA
jgi:N-acyl-D-aspartate/D-glutamate deacylase